MNEELSILKDFQSMAFILEADSQQLVNFAQNWILKEMFNPDLNLQL